jgi:hypothetical protein
VAQVVECLPIKCQALSSNLAQKKKKEKEYFIYLEILPLSNTAAASLYYIKLTH